MVPTGLGAFLSNVLFSLELRPPSTIIWPLQTIYRERGDNTALLVSCVALPCSLPASPAAQFATAGSVCVGFARHVAACQQQGADEDSHGDAQASHEDALMRAP